jgi:hypothetical protein
LLLLAAALWGAEPKPQHPLLPVLNKARECLDRIDNQIADYTCVLVKRERRNGRMSDWEYASVKLRHERTRDGATVVPFSVYMRFTAPDEIAGREVVYVAGRNGGNLIARRGGRRLEYITVAIDPRSALALRDNHYPITELGIRNLVERLLEVGEEELRHGEIEVKYFTGAKVHDRTCTVVQVTHPVPRDYFRYHLARIFIDDEVQLPIRYASYDWPDAPGEQPPLIEEYTYLDLKLNVGLKDADFDYRNPAYQFQREFEP